MIILDKSKKIIRIILGILGLFLGFKILGLVLSFLFGIMLPVFMMGGILIFAMLVLALILAIPGFSAYLLYKLAKN